ncbi:MAG: DUF4157 domain-containing protein, partial [Candidatus Schekmanbacteria bacterium]|nr:DUF4157 domain-containing protein [Candidatus Schekmanbacteria bacterium]
GTVAGSVEVTRDNDFRVASRRVNGANETAFSYDADGLLTAAGGLALTRDAATGFLSGTALGAVTDAYAYDAYGDVASYTASAGGGDPLYAVTFTRDALGRIAAKQETVQGETVDVAYSYDAAGRLASVTEDGVEVARWAYSANGNRLSATTPAGTVVASYDGQDRLASYGDTSYVFGAAGQLASKSAPAGTTDYEYDVLGNLRSVGLPDGRTIEYEVDGAGRRVGKKVDGLPRRAWLYQDALNPVAELDGSGAVVSVFVYASRAHVPDFMTRGGSTYRLISDHLGSVRLVVDAATGAVAQRIDYDAWGRVLLDTNPGFQPFGFAGGLYDPDTGLVRFGARDYDAEVGRWTARDPILFQGGQVNLFVYVANDPVNLTDPWGLEGLSECLADYLERKFDRISVEDVDIYEGFPAWSKPFLEGDELAFTLGDNIYFEKGKYNPSTRKGLELIIHELHHVEQYAISGKVDFLREYLKQRSDAKKQGTNPDEIPMEKEADKKAAVVMKEIENEFQTDGPCGCK